MNDYTELNEKQRELFERARKGVLQYLADQGGSLPMADLHDYSARKFFIQHQGFSRIMETFVDGRLVDYRPQDQQTTITEKGREFIQQ